MLENSIIIIIIIKKSNNCRGENSHLVHWSYWSDCYVLEGF